MKKTLFSTIALTFLFVTILLMLKVIVRYDGVSTNVEFLALKQDVVTNGIWLFAFYVHVYTAIFCLFAAFTQFSDSILRNHKNVHRWVGRLYAYGIIFINFPAALAMAFYANGGWTSQTAFLVLDFLWLYFTIVAVLEVKKKNIIAHRSFMIRSFALTFSAVTLRLWKIILLSLTDLDDMTAYQIVAWLGFVPNLIIAEIVIRKKKLLRF